MSGQFEVSSTPLQGLTVLRRRRIEDDRGFFERLFCRAEFSPWTGAKPIVQINHTRTLLPGTVRGLHYQLPPHAEIKIVQCLRGQVYDVAVDLRPDSPSYLHWHGELLGGENPATLVIPEGFAHGFQALSENCELLYFHTESHHPDAEAGIHPADPALAIPWPMPITTLSARDAGFPGIGVQNLRFNPHHGVRNTAMR